MSQYRATMRPRAVNLATLRARFNEAPASEESPAPEIVEAIPEIVEAIPAPEPTPEALAAADPDADIGDLFTEDPTPTWEPTWTKAQLLSVAATLGLVVDGTNTKAEIIAALTAAAPK
jgi:hypothetical protein